MYRSDIVDTLGEILSIAHHHKCATSAIESRIAHSTYFIAVEQNVDSPALYISPSRLINSIFYDIKVDGKIELFNQTLWAAELYIRIQDKTHLTFEAIFLYLPLEKAYQMYQIFHEMDFSQAIKYFISLTKKNSILSMAMHKNKVDGYELAKYADLSYPTISALRQQKRDINKVQAKSLYKISRYLHLRIESLLS